MTFFTTSELLEIGDIPFPSTNAKPTRSEALEYYRKVAQHFRLDLRQYETVESVGGRDGELLRRLPGLRRIGEMARNHWFFAHFIHYSVGRGPILLRQANWPAPQTEAAMRAADPVSARPHPLAPPL